MTVTPVSLIDTFDQWRTKTNQLIVENEQTDLKANGAYNQANAAYVQANAAFNKANTTSFTANLAITVADNTNAALRITQTGSADALRVEDEASDSTPFVVNASGNVGIGIASPTSKLHVIGTANITTSITLAGTDMITRLNNVGTLANNYTDAKVSQQALAGNTYTDTKVSQQALAGNTYTDTKTSQTGLSSNAYTDIKITQANVSIAGANANAANASYLSNGVVPSARLFGSYTGITGFGTISVGTWQAAPIAVNYGGTGGTTQIQARTNLGLDDLVCPTGAVMPFAGATSPAGWLLCDGSAVSRSTYATLYTILGGASSPYGQGDGSTTFNLPDLRGRVAAGKDDMGANAASRLVNTRTVSISTISQSTTVVTVTTSTAHGLTVGDSVTISGAGNATFNGTWTVASVNIIGVDSIRASLTFTFTHTISATIAAVAGGTITIPITNGVNGSSLGAAGGSSTHTLKSGELAAHNHSVYYNRDTPSGGSGDTADHSHSPTTGSGPYNTTTTGGNGPHNNVQPTIVLNYIIKT